MSTLYGSASAANNLRMSLLKNLNMISQSQQIMIDESRKYSLMIKDQSSDNIEMFCKRIAIILSNLINSSATLQSRLMAYEELVNKIENRYKNTGSFSNSETNQHWSYNNSHMTFDSPDALSSQLEISQKYGNCGLCSVQNVAAMKGVKLDQDYVFNFSA